jgi:hypothetical protein
VFISSMAKCRPISIKLSLSLLSLSHTHTSHYLAFKELGLDEVISLDDEVRQDPAFKRQSLQQRQSHEVRLGRDGCRVPLPWQASGSSMGFGPDGGRGPWLPQPQNWRSLSVASQESSSNSMLAMVRQAIAVRRKCAPLLVGGFSWADDVTAAAAPPSAEERQHIDSSVVSSLGLAAVSRAVSGAVDALCEGAKRLLSSDSDISVLAFERHHSAAGRVVCVFNMVSSCATSSASVACLCCDSFC